MKKLASEVGYAWHILWRPFDGFWDLKHEKKGSKLSATVILVALVLAFIIQQQFTGVLYGNTEVSKLQSNIIFTIFGVLFPFFLWCISNWCLTTLMDGEGTFGDIYMATAYACVPLIIILMPLSILSNWMALDMFSYYVFFTSAAIAWTGFLMVVSTLVVHQYGIFKTLITCGLIIVGIVIIIFLVLLFYNLCSQLFGFVLSIVNEITFRFF